MTTVHKDEIGNNWHYNTGKKALWIEDEEAICEIMSDINMYMAGEILYFAGSVEEAKALTERHGPWDAIISDFDLSRLSNDNACAFFNWLEKTRPEQLSAPTMFICAYSPMRTPRDIIRALPKKTNLVFFHGKPTHHYDVFYSLNLCFQGNDFSENHREIEAYLNEKAYPHESFWDRDLRFEKEAKYIKISSKKSASSVFGTKGSS